MVRTVAATPLVLMRRLHRDSGCERVLVGTLHDGEFLVEEAFPSSQLLGARLRIPPQLIGAPVMLDTRAVRLPLDWTLACAGRPSYLVASPVGDSGRTLVMAGHGEVPLHQPVANIAEQMAHLLAGGHTLQRDRSESRHLRALVDHLPSPVLFVDSRSFEVLLNDPARALLKIGGGQPNQSGINAALRRLVTSSGEDFSTSFSAGEDPDVTFDFAHGDQQYEVTSRWVDEERLTGRLWIFRDVTREREAARFRDELIANVSHELRTPLTSIIGALALLSGSHGAALPPEAQRLIEIGSKNAARLGRLVDDLLDAGRLEAGRLDFHLHAIDLGWLIADAVELNRPFASRCDIGLEFARPAEKCVVPVDPDRMAQVLGNLLSNAIKFSQPGGQVRITLACDDSCARISVIDQGCGMSEAFQQRLFTRFAREGGGGHEHSGTGLGLVIAQGLVKRMGGTIAVASVQGQGTTMTVALPLAQAGQAG